jgi:3-methylfumaryl-CoA hydratase
MADFDDWIGRSETRQDLLTEGLIDRFRATLNLGNHGIQVPLGLHWCLCLPDTPTDQLGSDGHPERIASDDSFMPPISLPRRMWASSAVDFLGPLVAGAPVARISTIKSIKEKQGGTGQLFFVDVEHETHCDGTLCVRETQSIVYREASTPAANAPAVATRLDLAAWDHIEVITPCESLLFRYSALTFNAHRIHYDLLLNLAGKVTGAPIASFSFRGQAPAICGEALHLAASGEGEMIKLAALTDDGRTIMSATASL